MTNEFLDKCREKLNLPVVQVSQIYCKAQNTKKLLKRISYPKKEITHRNYKTKYRPFE